MPAGIGTALTLFFALPLTTRSLYVMYTSVLRFVSTTRTTCSDLKISDMLTENTSDCCFTGPVK